MIFTVDLLPENHPTDTKAFFKDGIFDSITIHWTGPQYLQTPKVVRNWWLESGGQAAAHFIIKSNQCLQCVPFTKQAYHCGNPTGNRTSLGIEVIPMDEDGRFSDDSIKTIKELLSLFSPKPIFRHYDWSGKECPKYYINEHRWEKLKLAITPDSW